MAITQVAWIQSETYQALDGRLADTAVYGSPTTTLARPGGVIPGFGGNLAVTVSGLSASVASGACLVAENSGAGTYRVVNNAAVPVTIASGTNVARVDLIVVRVYDTGTPEGSYGAVEVVQGSPGTPTPMPAGANATKLAEVTVTNTATTVADFRASAVAVGGVIPGTSATRPANPYDGLTVWDNDTFNLAVYSKASGAWRTVPTGATGAWAPYTPTWIASVTNPTQGNSKLVGRYLKTGQTIHFTVSLKIGSSIGVGSGVYGFALPQPAVNITDSRQLVTAHFFDYTGAGTEASKQWLGNGLIKPGGTSVSEIRLTCGNSATASKGGLWTAGTGGVGAQPFMVDVNDEMTVSGTYECA